MVGLARLGRELLAHDAGIMVREGCDGRGLRLTAGIDQRCLTANRYVTYRTYTVRMLLGHRVCVCARVKHSSIAVDDLRASSTRAN